MLAARTLKAVSCSDYLLAVCIIFRASLIKANPESTLSEDTLCCLSDVQGQATTYSLSSIFKAKDWHSVRMMCSLACQGSARITARKTTTWPRVELETNG